MLGLKMSCYQLLLEDGGSYTTIETKGVKLPFKRYIIRLKAKVVYQAKSRRVRMAMVP